MPKIFLINLLFTFFIFSCYDKLKVGEKISVLLEKIEDKHGEVLVSASKAQKIKG